MKICIDARWIFPEISGIGTYTREILSQLTKLDSRNEYLVLFDNVSVRKRIWHETGAESSENFSAVTLDYGVFSVSGQFKLPFLLKKQSVDIYHSPNYMIPFLAFPRNRPGRTRCIVTIHDVIPLLFREHAPKSRKTRLFPLYIRVMRECIARADVIVTDSRASAEDIVDCLLPRRTNSEKVHPIYLGVNSRFKPRREQASKTDATVLYVGRMDPYKNLETLFRAIAGLTGRISAPLSLVIAGNRDPRYPEISRMPAEFGIEKNVRWTGYLTDDDLLKLYQESSVLAHPSRYEGFGLTILEAMACGLPVVCSNAGPLPEIAGGAAIMVDPEDPGGFADGIMKTLTDPDTASAMKQKGIENAARFTWRKSASELLDLYSMIAE